MSDGFDKEAEREKLREKLADDEQKREHTQRMSELLLKGATMTNRHCEECGDPIFRHDGREFCPTCGNEVGGAAGETPADADGTPADADGTPTGADGTPTDAGADAAGAAGNGSIDVDPADSVDAESTEADPVDAGSNETAQPRSPSRESAPSQGSAPRGSTPPQRSGGQRPEAKRPEARGSASQPPDTRPSPSSRSADDAEGIGAARASLTRTPTRFARAAEETDDPRRARDQLEAAREAAEALAALD